MTVSSNNRKNTYSGNGSTTVFPYTFKVLADTDLLVQIKDSSGVIITQTLTTHYTVSGAGEVSGGNVTFLTAPGATDEIIIIRSMPFQQNTDYVENDPLPAQSLEEALDELTMNDLQLLEGQERTIKFDSTLSSSFNTTAPTPEAGKFMKINSAGTGFTYVSGDPVAGVEGTTNEVDATTVGGTVTLSLSDTVDLGGHTSLEIPNGTAPSVTVAGQIAIDTDGPTAAIDQGMITYHDGTTQLYVPGVDATPSVDGYYLRYDGTNDKFVFANGGKVVQYVIATNSSDQSTTSTTTAGSGVSVSITPTSTSNKIVVLASFTKSTEYTSGATASNRYGEYKIRRTSGTPADLCSCRAGRILTAASTSAANSFQRVSLGGQETAPATSSQTYEIYFLTGSTSTTSYILGSSFGPTILIAYELEA